MYTSKANCVKGGFYKGVREKRDRQGKRFCNCERDKHTNTKEQLNRDEVKGEIWREGLFSREWKEDRHSQTKRIAYFSVYFFHPLISDSFQPG